MVLLVVTPIIIYKITLLKVACLALTHETCLCCSSKSGLMKLACLLIACCIGQRYSYGFHSFNALF